mgnify:CR=1 FL=1
MKKPIQRNKSQIIYKKKPKAAGEEPSFISILREIEEKSTTAKIKKGRMAQSAKERPLRNNTNQCFRAIKIIFSPDERGIMDLLYRPTEKEMLWQ